MSLSDILAPTMLLFLFFILRELKEIVELLEKM